MHQWCIFVTLLIPSIKNQGSLIQNRRNGGMRIKASIVLFIGEMSDKGDAP